ncbi:MAG TPA: HIT domain-containing protein [Microlunatus sp.]
MEPGNETGCTFCRIGAGDLWDQVFYADDHSAAFLDMAPATRGHTLVIPRRHSADIFNVGEAEFAALGQAVHPVARRLEDRPHPGRRSIVQSNRAAGRQDVFHWQVHLVPRYAGDGLTPQWTETSEEADEIGRLAASLRLCPVSDCPLPDRSTDLAV